MPPELYRDWMAARVAALLRDKRHRLSKKRCGQIAQQEWLELRRQHERRRRELAISVGRMP
jgi:hypothetical protein